VVAREDVILNPYYRHMGGLYGSEYWTYLLPRRVGATEAAQLTSPPFAPVGTREAVRLGLIDGAFGADVAAFDRETRQWAAEIADADNHRALLERKRARRARDEAIKPLRAYREEELARCGECFFGSNHSYHEARRRFVYKEPAPCLVGHDNVSSSRERLSVATRCYEQRVVAWHALGRVDEAHRAREAVTFWRQVLAAEAGEQKGK
jgi:putative two-component system hydrogenase maturation factor HypX/HoxX